MNKLLYSPEALNDLDEIWTYINNESQNPAAAQKIVSDTLDTIEIKLNCFCVRGCFHVFSFVKYKWDFLF
jgi:hypothetical protein